jgi:hypothetical protein
MLGGLAIWGMLLGPAGFIEYRIDNHFTGRSVLADFAVVVAPVYLYTLLAAFLLQLHLVAREHGTKVLPAMHCTLVRLPAQLRERAADARSAFRTSAARRPRGVTHTVAIVDRPTTGPHRGA